MVKKFLLALILVVTFVLTPIAQSPANAAAIVHQTNCKVINWDGEKSVCMRFYWSKQADGTGVRAEKVDVAAVLHPFCSGAAFEDARAWWVNPTTGNYLWNWTWGSEESCTFTKDLNSTLGKDTGSMNFDLQLRQGCNQIIWSVKVDPSGSYNWRYSKHADSPCQDGVFTGTDEHLPE